MDATPHTLIADGHRLHAASWGAIGAGKPTLVLMHGGLDCVATWKDFPEVLHATTGLAVLAYDRWGHGASEQLTGERTMAYRRREAGPVLADLFGYFGIDHAIIVGHSDGGAMGLMAAAHHPDTIHGVLALVPQILMHPSSAEGMHAARQAFESGKLRSGLARYHGDNTEAMFWGWYGAWTTPEAFAWSMADEISRIRCPISVLYGMQDEYGYKPNIEVLIEHYDTLLELVTLPACGHHPQHQARDEVLAMAVRLLARPGVVAPRPDLA